VIRATGLAAIPPEHSASLVAHLIEKKNMRNFKRTADWPKGWTAPDHKGFV